MHISTVKELDELREKFKALKDGLSVTIRVCSGSGCRALGSEDVYNEFKKELKNSNYNVVTDFAECGHNKDEALLSATGCQGLCQSGPLVFVMPSNYIFKGVAVKDVKQIIESAVLNSNPLPSLMFKDDEGKTLCSTDDIPFYKHQKKDVLRHCGVLNFAAIEEFISEGGFEGFVKAVSIKPSEIIDEVERSRLRGKGGGGFLVGRKWRAAVIAEGDERYVICNGDEGDPGAFMDASLMEGDPFSVIEGMLIAARAVGAKKGYIYVRYEYPNAVKSVKAAISKCREYGFLGNDILGYGFDFDIQLIKGGGAFVCGESSALMRSIEGETGEPRSKYIRSTEKGLFDKPTVLNNVETFASIPAIMTKGHYRFASIGTDNSKGTKAFCLSGKVKNTGMIEVEMGTTVEDIIFKIGGGVSDGRSFKAVQTGGPSGGCLPPSQLHLKIDFDELYKAGSMMGSGGIIVMDDYSCMVDVSRYFVEFLLGESCGKCVPCREGLFQLKEILNDISTGNGKLSDIDKLIEIGRYMQKSSICGLGKSAPNPVLSAISNFRDEFEEHIVNKKCRAGVCKNLTSFVIDKDLCTGCLLCKKVCAPLAITGEKSKAHKIDISLCTVCGECRTVCPENAISVL
ncbi:MAG: SLBB domain-containing protein [Deltaproteobacteria bacterium]|nr:SLBB domain-containing protein [Deltaproteobacteria bacterium]